jgi:hypothetical protein
VIDTREQPPFFERIGVLPFERQQFERDLAIEVCIPRPIHRSASAAPDLCPYLEMPPAPGRLAGRWKIGAEQALAMGAHDRVHHMDRGGQIG